MTPPLKKPSVIAIIPARGGSDRIPRKNLLPIFGRPLVAHSIMQARQSSVVTDVYVSTDDNEIANVAKRYGAEVIMRPADLSGPKTSSEEALLHVLDERKKRGLQDPELVVFLQCTSPVRSPGDIDRAVSLLREKKADTLFSAFRNTRLFWTQKNDRLQPINYDFKSRRMEQDMDVQWQENGSIYVIKPATLRRDRNRLGGTMIVYEMDEWSSFQIDSPEHVEMIQMILRRHGVRPEWPRDLELVVFDFDGVMTDNAVTVSDQGIESVRCNRADGLGVDYLRKAGVPMCILSTEKNPVVSARAKKLSIPCFQGIADKAAFLKKELQKRKISPKRTAYLGNDLNDVECFRMVGWPVAVADAHPDVLNEVRDVLTARGGHGAVREFCDRLLHARSKKT